MEYYRTRAVLSTESIVYQQKERIRAFNNWGTLEGDNLAKYEKKILEAISK